MAISSGTSRTVPARDFPQFMNLPKELRDLVWKFAIETPKVMPIRVETLVELTWSTLGRETEMHSISINTDCDNIFGLIRASRESGEAIMRHTTDSLRINGRLLRINTDVDTLYIENFDEEKDADFHTTWEAAILGKHIPSGIKHVAIPFSLSWRHSIWLLVCHYGIPPRCRSLKSISIVMGKRVLYASEGTSLKLLPHEKFTDWFPNRIRKLRNLEPTYSKGYLRDLFWDYLSLRSTWQKYDGLELNLMEWERTRVVYSMKEGGLQERTNRQSKHLNLGS